MALPAFAKSPEVAAGPPTQCAAADSETPAITADTELSSRRDKLSEILSLGFGVQYWGQSYDTDSLAAAPHGLLVLEATKIGAPHSSSSREQYFSPEEVATMKNGGHHLVIGYLNVSEIEYYRDYWVDAVRAATAGLGQGRNPFDWFGPRSTSNEPLALYWTPEWEEEMLARVDKIMGLGFDGILLDDVLHYYSFASGSIDYWPAMEAAGAPHDAPGFARAMMGLVERIATRAREHDCDALIIVNSGVYIGRDAGPEPMDQQSPAAFDSYLRSIDAILIESQFSPGANPQTLDVIREDFQDRGIEVLSVDFSSYFPDMSTDDVRNQVAWKAKEAGFRAYVADNEFFDRLYVPIIDPELAVLRK